MAASTRREERQHLLVGLAPAIQADRLDADMVGAGAPMLLEPGADLTFIAPRHILIDKAIGAAAGEIIVAKAEPAPIVEVVVEPQVVGERLAAQRARLRRASGVCSGVTL